MKRVAILALGLGLCSLSFASFDLMFVVDNNNAVHRVDPTTGAYLGNFALSFAPTAMVASYANKRLYALSAGRISAYDYSNGQLLNVFTVGTAQGGLAISPDGTMLYAGNTSTGAINRVTSGGVNMGAFISGLGSNSMSLSTDPSGNLYITSGPNSYSYTSTGALISTSTTPLTNATASAYSYGGSMFVPALLQVNGGSSYGWNIMSGSSLGSPVLYNLANMSIVQGTASGHLGAYVMGKDSASAGLRITKLEPYPQFVGASFVMPQITSHRASAIVLAPEPGTWATLGLGALTLLRRRKK